MDLLILRNYNVGGPPYVREPTVPVRDSSLWNQLSGPRVQYSCTRGADRFLLYSHPRVNSNEQNGKVGQFYLATSVKLRNGSGIKLSTDGSEVR